MASSPQDVYARSLLSHHGYPLRTPEPNIELPDSYRREGLKIGDVGIVVPEEGSFDVFFNITLPREHPLHANDGVPDSFTQVKLNREDYRIAPEAECPGRVISPSTVECAISCVDPFHVDGAARRLTDHQFSLHHEEGAMLILPQGAERHRLAKDLLLLDAILQNAVDWYRFARERLYRDISNDALYLITGFHKAHSWSLASFKNTRASSARCKIIQRRRGGSMISEDCTWETAHSLEWRIGPRHLSEISNQSVFIVGFKIAVNKELLYMQRVTVKVGHSRRTLATTLVGFGSSLANLLPWATSRMIYSSEGAGQSEDANGPTLECDPPDDEPEDVKAERVPRISQPFHPSDIINRYMLKKNPSAKIAVTHDNQWIALLEKGILTERDMLQEGRLEAAVSQEYNIVTKNGAVYLECFSSTEAANVSTTETPATDSFRQMPKRHTGSQRNIIFVGEIGAGKSSTINLLLGTGIVAPVSNDSRPCTKTSASYVATINDTKYNLWDTRGLDGAHGLFQTLLGTFGGSPEGELKKFLRERHVNQEIDLLVYCVRGSREKKILLNHYNEFCVTTRRLAAPVVIVVTHLEREKDMEDWWRKNSSDFKQLGIEFDDHVCITTLPNHHRRAESKKKLVDLITKNRHWEAKESGSYFGSLARKSPFLAPPHKTIQGLHEATSRVKSDGEGLSLRSSNYTSPSSRAPSAISSNYHTASSPSSSAPPSPVIEPPTPRSATMPVKVPQIDTDLLQTSDRPQPSSENTSSSTGDSLTSMFHSSSRSSDTSYSEVYLESCVDGDDDLNEPPFRPSTSAIRRRRGWASQSGAFGDVWECDLVWGHSSRMVAVKAVKTNIHGNNDVEYHEKKLRRELKIWCRLQHENIVPLLGVVSGFGPLPSTVIPWYRNGSLSYYMAENRVSGTQKHRLLGDIVVGLRYLHNQDVVHGDLHSGNILIDDDGTARITDFGLSVICDFLDTSYLKSSICGHVHFTDPALVQLVYNSQDYVFHPTKSCDIYSFGGVMLHVLSGKKPYDGISTQKTFLAVLDGERPQIPNNLKSITVWHRKLMLRCWDFDESKRPSAGDLVKVFDR